MSAIPTRDRLAAWLVLAVFLVITALLTPYVLRSSRIDQRARFRSAVQATRDTIQYRLDVYINVLTATSGLFAADEDMTHEEFHIYVRHLDLQHRYPGVQGIGLSLRVAPKDVAAVTQSLQREYPGFHIWPAGPRPEYHTIAILEPLDRRNRAAMGYDMHTSAPRAAAMDRARDTGLPAASGRVTLVQEIDARKQPGFLIYVPVYTTRLTPPAVAQRRAYLNGFVYAPFRIDDFFAGTFGRRAPQDVGFEIYDGDPSPQTQLYATAGGLAQSNPRFTETRRLNVAGRVWSIVFYSIESPARTPMLFAVATAAAGLIISFLLFALIHVQARARVQAEETAARLRASEADLQEANQTKDDFLATLSHELRTPMTAILGWSRLLMTPDLDDDTRATAVDSIHKSARAQAQLIDDLLDVSRIAAGKMRIEPRTVELAAVIRAAMAAVQPAANAKGVRIETEFPPHPVEVSGDPERLQQVLWNLLSNAVKFTPRAGMVTIELTTPDDEAEIAVRDSGQGIDPAFLPHVFERFRQADAGASRTHTGLGLGLAIVRHLVELHGGEVSAESEGLGRGATFRVRLPLLQSAAQHDAAAPRAAASDRLRGRRVLIVDDEEDVRNYVAAVFRMSGSIVACASSADDALHALEASPADVVLSDIGMPVNDGYELLRRIRARWPALPVVALTAYARADDRAHALQAGFAGFVPKPVEPAALRAAAESAMGW
jgi:signal transduction histidine kinase